MALTWSLGQEALGNAKGKNECQKLGDRRKEGLKGKTQNRLTTWEIQRSFMRLQKIDREVLIR